MQGSGKSLWNASGGKAGIPDRHRIRADTSRWIVTGSRLLEAGKLAHLQSSSPPGALGVAASNLSGIPDRHRIRADTSRWIVTGSRRFETGKLAHLQSGSPPGPWALLRQIYLRLFRRAGRLPPRSPPRRSPIPEPPEKPRARYPAAFLPRAG